METKPVLVLQYPHILSNETLEKMQPWCRSLEAATGAEVLILPAGVKSQYHQDLSPLVAMMTRSVEATEANTAAVLELCGLVAASFEEGKEEAYDAPGAAQTMNSPRRK